MNTFNLLYESIIFEATVVANAEQIEKDLKQKLASGDVNGVLNDPTVKKLFSDLGITPETFKEIGKADISEDDKDEIDVTSDTTLGIAARAKAKKDAEAANEKLQENVTVAVKKALKDSLWSKIAKKTLIGIIAIASVAGGIKYASNRLGLSSNPNDIMKNVNKTVEEVSENPSVLGAAKAAVQRRERSCSWRG